MPDAFHAYYVQNYASKVGASLFLWFVAKQMWLDLHKPSLISQELKSNLLLNM